MRKRITADVLEQLYAVREEVQSAIEASVSTQFRVDRRLNEVIQKLEEAQDESPNKRIRQEILMMFGQVIEMLPAIAQLLERLRDGR